MPWTLSCHVEPQLPTPSELSPFFGGRGVERRVPGAKSVVFFFWFDGRIQWDWDWIGDSLGFSEDGKHVNYIYIYIHLFGVVMDILQMVWVPPFCFASTKWLLKKTYLAQSSGGMQVNAGWVSCFFFLFSQGFGPLAGDRPQLMRALWRTRNDWRSWHPTENEKRHKPKKPKTRTVVPKLVGRCFFFSPVCLVRLPFFLNETKRNSYYCKEARVD